jgi:hypothetical protein
MEIRRKFQISAALVIANGLLALTAGAPETAQAATCSPKGGCGCWTLAQCQAAAPAGCTATSATCRTNINCGAFGYVSFVCNYS